MIIDNDNEKEKALIFSARKTTVHISKLNGIWDNGIILEVGSNFFILKSRLDGRENIILFDELKHPIEVFKEVEK